MFGHSGIITAEYDIWSEYQDRQNEFLASLLNEDPTGRCGYVYLFEMIPTEGYMRDGCITFKIGRSKDPEQRLREVRRSNVTMPYRIKLWQTIWAEDSVDAESTLHKMLGRYRLSGEWFSLPQGIWESIMNLWYISGSHQHGHGLEFHWDYPQSSTPAEFFQQGIENFRREIANLPKSIPTGTDE